MLCISNIDYAGLYWGNIHPCLQKLISTKANTKPDTEELLTLNVSVQNNGDLEALCRKVEVLGQFDRINDRTILNMKILFVQFQKTPRKQIS